MTATVLARETMVFLGAKAPSAAAERVSVMNADGVHDRELGLELGHEPRADYMGQCDPGGMVPMFDSLVERGWVRSIADVAVNEIALVSPSGRYRVRFNRHSAHRVRYFFDAISCK